MIEVSKNNEELINDYYSKIYNWYATHGVQFLEAQLKEELTEKERKGVWFNLEFTRHLPKPGEISPEIIDYIVTQIIKGKLEYAFNLKDEEQTTMKWYAFKILEIKYGNSNAWSSIDEATFSNTELFKTFGNHHETLGQYSRQD